MYTPFDANLQIISKKHCFYTEELLGKANATEKNTQIEDLQPSFPKKGWASV